MAIKIKSLMCLTNQDLDKAEKIARLINGTDCPEIYQSVQKWVNECYNRPSVGELKMMAADELLEGLE